jgi:serine/threonine protein kinase
MKLGVNGFEKRVVIRCAERDRLDTVVAEAKKAARLSHAGIAHVLDAGAFEDVCYVASEYVPGITLDALILRRGPLPWPAVARVVSDAAAALAYTHARRSEGGELLGIIHRRITPRRITVTGSGGGRSPMDEAQRRLHGGKITGVGTSWAWPDHQGWGSPEEMRGEPIDGRADVFGLGLILRRCVNGDVPPELDEIVEHAMHPLPEHRCTAGRLHEWLTLVLREAVTRPQARVVPELPRLR